MKHFVRIIKKNPKIRESAVTVGISALAHSAEATDFGFVSLNNAQGASEAVAELSHCLDDSLNDFELGGGLSGERQLLESRLTVEARKYSNSYLDENVCGQKWSCSEPEAQLISVAVNCAARAYDQGHKIDADGMSLQQLQYVPHSGNGTIKATTLTLVRDISSQKLANTLLPVLVVAIKGSKTVVDWMVNLNSRVCDADRFLDLKSLNEPTDSPSISIHSGFLNGAEAILPILTRHLGIQLKSGKVSHVLLTGHSSGGAVASLVYAKLLSVAATQYPSIKFSLITFGAPPVSTADLTPLFKTRYTSSQGMALAFVNEHDPIPRSDTDYIRSIVNLYRSRCKLGPVVNDDEAAAQQAPALASAAFDSKAEKEGSPQLWKLPAPLLVNLGEIVVLKDANPDGDEVQLNAVLVSPREFSNLLFVRSAVHSRAMYLDNIRMLKDGKINSAEGG